MHFHQRCSIPNTNISFEGCTIEETKWAKFLGLIIDNQLTWKSHIKELSKKLSKSAHALQQLSKKINRESL